ncbi:cell filamentation protein Fic [Bacteroidia bacterium]|nr:cell filamentation protein Fic [Bacteroidia bacterium]
MNEFDEYIRQGEPDKIEKSHIWQTAIGLQQVDGLTPSAYLIETAKQNIEGDITFDEVKSRIDTYYQTKTVGNSDDDRTEEADKVSSRIAEILSSNTFSFSPVEYIGIHRRLFSGIYKFAGKIRDYDISKKEWVLDGKTVLYASAINLRETLEYDFKEEKAFNYKGLSQQQIVEHIVHFVAYLWQIHIFGEGNTRTTAVFTIKYLRTFGFEVSNDAFAQNSWYFRNALVRANYNDFKNGIHATNEYLMRFFGNLLLGENNVLRNRELHIHFVVPEKLDVNKNTPNILGVNQNKLGVKLNKNQFKMLELIENNNKITIIEMAKSLSISETAIENNIKKLREKGILSRVGSDKTGHWQINNFDGKK